MKKILLDTTYFLPFIGITIEGMDPLLVQKMAAGNGNQVQLSEITLFELAAKGAKIATDTVLTYQEVVRGLDTLRYDKRLHIQSWTSNPTILELAYAFRAFHADFIDCLILATAVCSSEIYATYDDEVFNKIVENKKAIATITTINPQFSFWFEDLSKESIPLKKS
ncbi:MAG TPA: hypothetical protein VMZ29_08485 [Candidatus Bathyarchaeia archaeon]|nr:hypothetical protein [Candidatus Bathyarchaeia archaeon]